MKFKAKVLIFCHLTLWTQVLFGTTLELERTYQRHCQKPTDINEHLPFLSQLATECETAVEIGVRNMVSTWAILKGLSENKSAIKSYIGIDIAPVPGAKLLRAQRLAGENEIAFEFWQKNDMEVELDLTDLLFIDSLHTYCHLMYELEKFSLFITKYIALHDTSEPWGIYDDNEYHGDYSEYPSHFDRTKRGLWAAVVDFLYNHPEWKLFERRYNNHGFTVLTRSYDSD